MSIARLWNYKADSWLKGRRNLYSDLKKKMDNNKKEVIWMHCASLGEFEQGRPVIERIKKNFPDLFILITFFSPSGFENIKNYKGADCISYLPLDTRNNAKKFLNIVDPKLVLWVKYEYWYHFLNALSQRKIPVLLISGIFRKNQMFFKSFGQLWKNILSKITYFFLQDNKSSQLLQKIGFNNTTVSGDTRFDRVLEISQNVNRINCISEFCSGHKVIVAGSTWEEDEVLLIHYLKINPQVRLILAPHEIDRENLINVRKNFPRSIYYSEWCKLQQSLNIDNKITYNCLIIDNIGMLSVLYKYADVCYVGGGFGAEGVHNVLEPAVFGKPVLFGPEYEKYLEASELIECGGADEIKNAIDLEQSLDALLNNEIKKEKWGSASREYVINKAGATDSIVEYIYKNRLLTS